jgi:hypothetical protein
MGPNIIVDVDMLVNEREIYIEEKSEEKNLSVDNNPKFSFKK